MNILFVSPRIPYPLDSGAKIRTFNLLRGLASNNKVILLSYIYNTDDEKYISVMEKMNISVVAIKGKPKYDLRVLYTSILEDLPLNIAKYNSIEMRIAISSLIREEGIDVVHFDHVHLGQYVNLCHAAYTVIDEHNVESMIMERVYRNERNPIMKLVYKNEHRKLKKIEKEKCQKASLVTVVSEEDKRALQALCSGAANIEVIPNGVDGEYFSFKDSPLRGQPLEDAVVFTGVMDWLPNIDAVEYFIKDILLLIWAKKPEVKFYVVGKNPPQRIKNLAETDPRIIVTGSVSDVRPYVFKSKVFVVPLRIGGGTRLKILEALSMEKAVVSTSIGAEGLNVNDGKHIFIADSAEAFAAKVADLLSNDNLRRCLGAAGRGVVMGMYEWKIINEQLARLYEGKCRCQSK